MPPENTIWSNLAASWRSHSRPGSTARKYHSGRFCSSSRLQVLREGEPTALYVNHFVWVDAAHQCVESGGGNMSKIKTALIVGASRGLGLTIAEELLKRNWNVIGTVREGKRTGLHNLAEMWDGKLQVKYLDMTIPSQIERLKSNLIGESLDLLFVSAGVANEKGMKETIGEISTEEFVRVMVTNTLSPMRVLETTHRECSSRWSCWCYVLGTGKHCRQRKRW